MSAVDILPQRSIFMLPGVVSYLDGGDEVTPVIGQLGGVATMGDGSTANTIPGLIKPRGFAFGNTGLVDGGGGAASYVDLGDDDILTQPTGFTLACLVAASSGGSGGGVIAKDNAASPAEGEFRLVVSGGAPTLTIIDQDAVAFISRTCDPDTVHDGVLSAIVATWGGGTTGAAIKIFVDAEQKDTTSGDFGVFTAPDNTSDNLLIGKSMNAIFGQFSGLVVAPMLLEEALPLADVELLSERLLTRYANTPR